MRPNEASFRVIGAALKVHSSLGAGLLESAYDAALRSELATAGLRFQHQVRIAASYQGQRLPDAYRIDFIVERCLIVELKRVARILPVHRAQLTSYLRLTGHLLGLLLNFNVPHLRDGIHRTINGPASELLSNRFPSEYCGLPFCVLCVALRCIFSPIRRRRSRCLLGPCS